MCDWNAKQKKLQGVSLYPSSKESDMLRDEIGVRSQTGSFVGYAVALLDVLSTYAYVHHGTFTTKVSVEMHVEFAVPGVPSEAESVPQHKTTSETGKQEELHSLLNQFVSDDAPDGAPAAQEGLLAFSSTSVKMGRTLSRLELQLCSSDGSPILHATHTKCVLPGIIVKLGGLLPNGVLLTLLQFAAVRAPKPAPCPWHLPGPHDLTRRSETRAENGEFCYETALEQHWGNTFNILHGAFVSALLHAGYSIRP